MNKEDLVKEIQKLNSNDDNDLFKEMEPSKETTNGQKPDDAGWEDEELEIKI